MTIVAGLQMHCWAEDGIKIHSNHWLFSFSLLRMTRHTFTISLSICPGIHRTFAPFSPSPSFHPLTPLNFPLPSRQPLSPFATLPRRLSHSCSLEWSMCVLVGEREDWGRGARAAFYPTLLQIFEIVQGRREKTAAHAARTTRASD